MQNDPFGGERGAKSKIFPSISFFGRHTFKRKKPEKWWNLKKLYSLLVDLPRKGTRLLVDLKRKGIRLLVVLEGKGIRLLVVLEGKGIRLLVDTGGKD